MGIIIISSKLHLPSIKSNILTKRSCSFWKFSEKGASRLPLNGNNLNTLLLILPNNKKNTKKTRTTSIEKSFTTFNYYLVKDAIVDRRLFSIKKILLLLVA